MSICPIFDKSVIAVTGNDRATFLQAQLTADIEALAEGNSCFACHCDAKGKTWAIYEVLCEAEQLLLITDTSTVNNSLNEFKKYGVFAKATFTDVTDQYYQVGVAADHLSTTLEQLAANSSGNSLQAAQAHSDNFQSQCIEYQEQHLWTTYFSHPIPRYRLLVPIALANASDADLSNLALEQLSATAQFWAIQHIQAGIPTLTTANSASFIPQQMNMQALDAICFTKGCYMGQEMVARTKYLGKNKRAGAILKADTALPNVELAQSDTSESAPALQLEMQLGDNWRRSGTVLSIAGTNEQTWLFAVLPNDLAGSEVFRLSNHPEVNFTLQTLPYSLTDAADAGKM